MDEDLKNRLIGYLDSLEKAAKVGGDFAGEQIPLVIQEFLQYSCFHHTVWAALWSILLLFSVLCFVSCVYFAFTVDDTELGGTLFIFSIMSFFACIPFTLSTVANWLTVYKITHAPRVFIIETIADLVK